jgi:hypothetical protein
MLITKKLVYLWRFIMKAAAFIAYHLKVSHKTHVEIAREVGLSSSNLLSMMKSGSMKIPLDRVPALADSL